MTQGEFSAHPRTWGWNLGAGEPFRFQVPGFLYVMHYSAYTYLFLFWWCFYDYRPFFTALGERNLSG